MKKFYKLIPLLALAVITPTTIAMTSCSGIQSGTYEITLNELNVQTAVKNLKHGPNLKSLLWGNKSAHKGNYVVFIATQASAGINQMLFDKLTVFNKNTRINQQGNSSLTADSLTEINTQISSIKNDDDCGFYWCNTWDVEWTGKDAKWFKQYAFGDNMPQSGLFGANPNEGSKNDDFVLPFAKWNDIDQQHYEANKKEYKKCKAGKWIRNDAHAKSWRQITSDLSKLYGISGNNSFVMMQWVQGKLANKIAVDEYKWDTTKYNDPIFSKLGFIDSISNTFKTNIDKKVK